MNCTPLMKGKQVYVLTTNNGKMLMARQAISSISDLGEGASQQRENFIYTPHRIIGKLYSLVIDGGDVLIWLVLMQLRSREFVILNISNLKNFNG